MSKKQKVKAPDSIEIFHSSFHTAWVHLGTRIPEQGIKAAIIAQDKRSDVLPVDSYMYIVF